MDIDLQAPFWSSLSMKTSLLSCILFISALQPTARAGVFNIPEFVEYKSWAVGLEPEAILSAGPNTQTSGVGATLKFTYGITPLSNLQFGLGEGSGSKGFRFGGTYTFDFIPDLEGQFGAGLALQSYYYKVKNASGQTEITIYPYMHKMFTSETGYMYDPYLALPFGLAFYNGNYGSIWQLVFGNYLKVSSNFGLNLELGLNLKDTDTYLSGGVTYRD